MPANPQRVKELFGAAIDITEPAERQAFLDRACGDDADLRRHLDALLAAYAQPNSVLDQPLAALAPGASQQTGPHEPAQRELPIGSLFAGRYKIREKLGEGGMGSVYVAEQTEPVVRRVAVKVIKADVSSARLLARFEQERQALALMDHPNIAKVLDAGITSAEFGDGHAGVPYFVMELIKGVPITRYCDEAKLTPRQRLELFLPVCQAVQHAHQKGIIHRDLKPSNILVGLYDGHAVPKVIDFGVAKVTGPKLSAHTVYTEVGQIVGTLEYMSPEQAELNNLDIDTRSDIYALGVLLYELLTGTVPFSRKELKSAGFAEMLRIIKEIEPPRPSTRLSSSANLPSIAACRQTLPAQLTKLLRGDLDWMVMKALEKDRARRYETANGFAMDMQRYLANEPVLARPPSTGYRVRKFVQRNKAQVLAACLVFLALICGVVGTTWGLVRAEQLRLEADAARNDEAAQRSEAERQRDKALAAEKLAGQRLAQVQAEQKRVLEEKRRAEANEKKAAQEKRNAEAVRDFLRNNLLGQADMTTQANALLRVGAFPAEANRNVTVRELLDRTAAELTPEKLEANFPGQPELQRELLQTVGSTYRGVGEPGQAVLFLQRAAALARQHLGADHSDTLDTLHDLAGAYQDAGKLSDAVRLFEQIRAVREKKRGSDHLDTLITQSNLAVAYVHIARVPEAIRLLQRVSDTFATTLGPDHPATLTTLGNLAMAYRAHGKWLEVIRLFEVARAATEKKFGPDHPATLDIRNKLASAYRDAGKLPEAIRLFEQVRAAREKTLGPDHPQTLNTLAELALAYQHAGRLTEAVRLFEQVHVARQKKLGPDHPATLSTLGNLGLAYREAGRLSEALRLFEQLRNIKEKKLGPDHPSTLATLHNLAVAYQDVGKRAEAIRLHEHVGETLQKKLGPSHPHALSALDNLAAAYRTAGKLSEAIRLHQQVHAARLKSLGPDHRDTLTSAHNLAAAYWSAKQLDRSIPLFEDVLKRQEATLGRDHPATRMTLANLGVNYLHAGRLEDAVALLEQANGKGKAHPSQTFFEQSLLTAYLKAGKASEGSRLIADLVARARKRLPTGSIPRANEWAFRASQLLDLKQHADALPLLRECLSIRTTKEPDAWTTFNTQAMLGAALLGLKKYAAAEPLLVKGYQGMKERAAKIPPPARERLTEALRSLVQLYEATGKKEEAERWRRELQAQMKSASASKP